MSLFFFFNDPATTEIYTYSHTLSLHDALPISIAARSRRARSRLPAPTGPRACNSVRSSAAAPIWGRAAARSEEHTSELQSLMRISYAVFCLKKKKKTTKSGSNQKAQSTNANTDEHTSNDHNRTQI